PTEKHHVLKYLADPRIVGKDVPSAVAILNAALDESEIRLVAQATNSLAAIVDEDEFMRVQGGRLETQNLTRVKILIDALKRYRSKGTFDFLSRKFREGPNTIRMTILDVLKEIGDDHVLPLLVDALNHRRIDIRTKAGEVLCELSAQGRADVARTIVWLLR